MTSKAERDDIDLDLMQRVARGEEDAVALLYDRFASLVYRMAFQVMPSRADADDAVQEIFVRLWGTAKRYDPKRSALVTWVMLITRRHLVDKLRRNQARIRAASLEEPSASFSGSGLPQAAATSDEPGLDTNERYRRLMALVSDLPEMQRTVVIRAYLGGQTLRQIGEELNTPIGTIKSALSRALLRLRELSAGEA